MKEIISAEESTEVVKYYDDGKTTYPCYQNNPKQFLKTFYEVETLREDYLDKQIQAHCAAQMFGPSDNTKPVLYRASQSSAW